MKVFSAKNQRWARGFELLDRGKFRKILKRFGEKE
jgi:hypothetical protein